MKAAAAAAAAADRPCELFRWKSSCGRLSVRTTWVKGVRHVVLSDEEDDGGKSREKDKRPRRRRPPPPPPPLLHDDADPQWPRPPLTAVRDNGADENWHEGDDDDDDGYVDRVLQWLQKPSARVPLETCQKPMTAPSPPPPPANGGSRRPALVKTCSIPENGCVQAVRQVARTRRQTKSSGGGECSRDRQQKTELHVHMPSTCGGGGGAMPANGRRTAVDDYHCF